MKNAIIIPARYASTRFPGKPLHQIAGKPMMQHVYEIAKAAAERVGDCVISVAVDDTRVADEAERLGIPYIMTPQECVSGSDRVLAAIEQLEDKPEFVINLQGDSPLTPVNYLVQMLSAYQNDPQTVLTLAVKLNWAELAEWRKHKENTPFSGTSVMFDKCHRALWFSKQILPTMRQEEKLKTQNVFSPVYRHVGIYGYSYQMLKTFTRLPEGYYETLEGLEQLRLLENGYQIQVLEAESCNGFESIGVDTIEDAHLVEAKIAQLQEMA